MPDIIVLTQEPEIADNEPTINESESCPLASSLEELLMAAQPRLERLARAQGVAPDGVDDVLQETLIEAWQHLEHLRTPERFDAWLNGICRNVCLRWLRMQGTTARRQSSFSALQYEARDGSVIDLLEIADPLAPDLDEELSRQDLAVLLDRAMGHLPQRAREALELHYIADLPQREIAQRLGVSTNALEVKLHRARRQLRQVLSGALRAEAESFGLAVDAEQLEGWRSTGIWCFICGSQRMLGCFEPLPHGGIDMRLRCPVCSPSSRLDHMDIVNTCGVVPLENLRSFRPALKRTVQMAPAFYVKALQTGYQNCLWCKTPAKLRGIEQYTFPPPFHKRVGLVLECPQCGDQVSGIISACMDYAIIQQFLAQHPRCILGSEEIVDYQGQETIHISLVDMLSASQLTLFLHSQTLQPLATILE
ncbi:MAG TPA: RNA polymerase sigma factor [Ktedonobacteraceae bacterium]|nr:RNA polymerase sigma factor [Ktedonobacteraceae bacterium]